MKEKLLSLNTIPFVGCLAILLLNDFYLKVEYSNWLTGKLSDFCGLFVFASFWAALFPARKVTVCFSTALLFVIWKSPYSQTFIDFFSQNLYPIDRIVDVTDLIAVPVLAVAFIHSTEHSIKLKLHPVPIALLTIISFCATSLPLYKQTFSQPQFILFKSGIVDFVNSDRPSRYQVYDLDSFVVISIDEIRIDRQAVIDDGYHKTQILSDLDLQLVRDSQEPYGDNDPSGYKTLRDSLTVSGRTAITLKHDSVSDEMNFKNSRLDGDFRRSMNDQLLFEGKFRNGVEDSVWTYFDESNKVVTRKYFRNGELTRTEQFENAGLVSDQIHQTRDDIVRNKYFHLTILGLLVISVLGRLILNFRNSEKENIIRLSSFLTVLGMIGLPLVVLILAKLISSWIPYSYSNMFLGIFIEGFFVYLITAPSFLLVLAVLKLRSKFDLVLYILLFSLSLVLIEEWIQMKALI